MARVIPEPMEAALEGRFTDTEMRERFERGSHSYRGYQIQAKRDYVDVLSYDRGFYLRDGFVVVKDGCNAMPGAAWFKEIDRATQAIDILEAVGEKRFWAAYEHVRSAVEQARAAALAEFAESSAAPSP